MDWMKEVVTRYAVIGKAGQAHMSVGLAQGAITSDEARTFMEAIRRKGHHHDLAEIGLSCIIDFKAAMSSHVDGRAHELAERFDELALFDEFIILDSSSYKSSETSHD
jgi:hypothetical protein